jgi:hypothetical protein
MALRNPSATKMWVALVSVGLITAGVVAVAAPVTAWAKEPPPNPQEFFIYEFVGGLFGGVLASYMTTEIILRSWCAEADDPGLCRRAGRVALRPIVYPALVFLGSTAGILTVGWLAGVHGSLLFTVIGGFAGTMAGLVEAVVIWNVLDYLFEPGRAEELVSPPETPPFLKRAIPLIIEYLRPYESSLKEFAILFLPAVTASSFGTIGYNSGTRIPAE